MREGGESREVSSLGDAGCRQSGGDALCRGQVWVLGGVWWALGSQAWGSGWRRDHGRPLRAGV